MLFTELHRQAVDKKRRVIVRLDALGEFQMQKICGKTYLDYIFGFLDKLPHQIDSIFWDITYDGNYFSIYKSDFLPQRKSPWLDDWLRNGFHLFEEVLNRSQKSGYENFIVHRISEVSIDALANPPMAKYEHPEDFIRSWEDLGLENMASQRIREHKLKVIAELLRKFDFDGVDIDFCRHTPFLEPGRQWELRENVTTFMKDVRTLCNEIEKEKEKPVMVSARVPDSITCCEGDGIDVPAIVANGSVDMLTLGSRSFEVDIENFRKITGEQVKLYPCYDSEHCSDGYMYPPIEVMRGVFCNWWQRGADGVETFNWRTTDDETRKEIMRKIAFDYEEPDTVQEQAYKEIGDYEIMKPLDKTFVAERRGGYPWGEGQSYNNETKQLPLRLYNHGGFKDVNVYVSDEPGVTAKSRTLNLIFYGMWEDDRAEVKLNGKILKNCVYDFSWKELQVWAPAPAEESGGNIKWMMIQHRNPHPEQKLLRCSFSLDVADINQGNNVISVALKRTPHSKDNDNFKLYNNVTLEKAEIEIKY